MIASEVMTQRVVTVEADMTVQAAARVMLEGGVRATPVVNFAGRPIGMVSDGDLLRRGAEDRGREWWLEMLAGATTAPPAADAGRRRVSDAMTAPLIFVTPHTPVAEIAALLQARRIKRLPVVGDGRLVGIVSRADLLAIVEGLQRDADGKRERTLGLLRFLESMIGGASLTGVAAASGARSVPPGERWRQFSADDLRSEARAFERQASERAAAEDAAIHERERREARAIALRRLSEASWRRILDRAEAAARAGERECAVNRFPSDLCSDGGRMIDVAEPGWEATLRGEPAEIVERWRRELKPRGFGLSARVVSYVDGILGDLGLFLTWRD